MLLDSSNCTNPAFWGKDLTFTGIEGNLPLFTLKPEKPPMPKEFYFDYAFLGYKWVYGKTLWKQLNQ